MPSHKNTRRHNNSGKVMRRAGLEVDDDADARIQLHTKPRTNSSTPDCRSRATLVMNLAFGSRELSGITKLTIIAKTSPSLIVCSSVCMDWVGLVVCSFLLLTSSGSIQTRQPGMQKGLYGWTEYIERQRLCVDEQLIVVYG